VLNDISTWRIVGLFWVPEHAGVQGSGIADKLTTGGSVLKFVGPEQSFRFSRQNIKRKIKHWVDIQHLAMWHGPSSNQRQAEQLITGPSPTTKTRLLSFYKTQSRVTTGLLAGGHLHLMGLISSPLYRRCGTEEETSVHILCECEALASLRHAYLFSFFLDPEDIGSISLGAIWMFSKGTVLP
jgi:hypothetical protein